MKKILIIKPSSLGDIIHALPILPLLRTKFPEAHISWLVNDSFAGIVELFPAVDQIILFRRKRWGKLRYCGELLSFLYGLGQYHFDIVIDLQGLLRSGIFSWVTRAKHRIGFANAREGSRYFYNEHILLPANLKHAVDKNIFLVRSAFHITEQVPKIALRCQTNYQEKANQLLAKLQITDQEHVICVAPVARWQSKSCSPQFFAETLQACCQDRHDLAILLIGTSSEREVGEKIVEQCPNLRLFNIMGDTDLGTLVECLRKAEVLLTNDSGPMHIAAALQTPVVAIFGPTSAELTGPYGKEHVVFSGECEHRPCFSKICPLKVQTCLTVNPIQVAEAVIKKIANKKES